MSFANGVKPFKGQSIAIPGLETHKGAGAGAPKKQAIMRRVPMKQSRNYKIAAKRAEDSVEE